MGKNKKIIFTTSWDDGYSKDLKLAKLLDKYGIKGTFYIPIISIDKRLPRDHLLEISENHEIGCHTVTHCTLNKVPIDVASNEINDSKKQLERILDREINCFCYPKGEYNEIVKNLVKNSGFICARTIERFHFSKPNDLFEMGTTIQTLRFKRDIIKVLKITKSPLLSIKSLDWSFLAKFLFNRMLNTGGVYHLWGHSWEIEKTGFWNKLEDFLNYVANRKEVYYVTNGVMIKTIL